MCFSIVAKQMCIVYLSPWHLCCIISCAEGEQNIIEYCRRIHFVCLGNTIRYNIRQQYYRVKAYKKLELCCLGVKILYCRRAQSGQSLELCFHLRLCSLVQCGAGRGIWERASLSHEKKCQKKISRIIRDLLRLSRPRNEACQVRTLNILYGCFLVSIG